jgi:hypothetical protein
MEQRPEREVIPPDGDHYVRLADAFFQIPPTPDSRLQRDVWNRLNALNKKKLDGILKERRKQERLQLKKQRRERRAAEAKSQTKIILKATCKKLEKWKDGFMVIYRRYLGDWLNRLFRACVFLVWWFMILRHVPGKPFFASRIALIMP